MFAFSYYSHMTMQCSPMRRALCAKADILWTVVTINVAEMWPHHAAKGLCIHLCKKRTNLRMRLNKSPQFDSENVDCIYI